MARTVAQSIKKLESAIAKKALKKKKAAEKAAQKKKVQTLRQKLSKM